MNPRQEILKAQTRRQMFKDSVTGLGTIALASLTNADLFAATPAEPRRPAAPARRLISRLGPRTSSICTWRAPLDARHVRLQAEAQ